MNAVRRPLEGIRVLDFSSLLPGPLAGLLLCAAGAEVIKIERPGAGDEMRSYVPKFGTDSVNFALLNAGKKSIAIDLKEPGAVDRLKPLIENSDILIEQFRPGVMDRLGLGYGALSKINKRLIYCSVTGWGQNGPKAQIAAHDLNYMAEAGLLGLTGGKDGAPALPPILAADIAAGAYPAVINILLALWRRDRVGEGAFLDIAMGENLLPLAYWGLGNGFAAGKWPRRGADLVTGGSPRYQIYRTADGQFLAAAPIEEKFWQKFCDKIALAPEFRTADSDAANTIAAVADIIARRSASEWMDIFGSDDVCCSIVADLDEAAGSAHFQQRGVFCQRLIAQGRSIAALPLPIAQMFRNMDEAAAPALGQHNDEYL